MVYTTASEPKSIGDKTEFLQVFFHQSSMAICYLDAQFCLAHFNPTAELLFGLATADIGKRPPFLPQFFSDSKEPTLDRLEQIKTDLGTGQTLTFPYSTPGVAGEEMEVKVLTSALFQNGIVAGYSLCVADTPSLPIVQKTEGNSVAAATEKQPVEARSSNKTAFVRTPETLHYHFENIPLGVIEWKDERVLSWSKQAENIFGWTEEEARGKTDDELQIIFPDDERTLQVRDDIWSDQGTKYTTAVRNRTKEGKAIWCQWYISVIRNEAGAIIDVLTFVQDVTAQRSAEEKINESKRQLGLIYDTVQDILFMLDVEGDAFRFASVNNHFLKATGLTADQIIGQNVTNVIPEPSLSLVLENYRKAIAQKHSVQWEEVTLYPTGLKTGVVTITPVFDAAGSCVQMVGSVYDITERKRAEKELVASETRLKTILETEPECIKLLGKEGQLLQMNGAGLKMIEADSLEQVSGRYLHDLIEPPYRSAFSRLATEVLKGGSGELEFIIRGLKGTRRWLQTKAVPLRNEEEEIIAILGVTRDISEQKEQQEKLHQLTLQLRQLADHLQRVREEERQGIAREIHDEMGQLLTALKMDIYWAQTHLHSKTEAAAEKLDGALNLINVVIDAVRRIVSELYPVMLKDLGLVEALDGLCQTFKKSSGLTTFFKSNVTQLSISKEKALALYRISQEALTNVQRHAQAKTVQVTLQANKASVRLSVTDDGTGFASSVEPGAKSFGLLGIRERSIMSGGQTQIKSVAGGGTTITVTIPLNKSHE